MRDYPCPSAKGKVPSKAAPDDMTNWRHGKERAESIFQYPEPLHYIYK